MMKKAVVQIGLEFVFGPILKDDQLEDGSFSCGSSIVDNDEIVKNLDKQTNDLWISLYSNDENSSSGMKFDYEKEKEIAPKLLELITKILKRIEEINDGSFEVHDMISDHLKSLID